MSGEAAGTGEAGGDAGSGEVPAQRSGVPRVLPPTPAEIARRFTLDERVVELPGLRVPLLKPRNSDDLISEADYVKDERLPYWADLWVSAEVLATYVVEQGSRLRERVRRTDDSGVDDPAVRHPAQRATRRPRAIELGCGLGLPSIAAASLGFDVLATDYYEDALLFAAHNADRALGRPLDTRLVDWSALPADLGAFDLVLAADVLYEPRYAEMVANAVASALAPDGVFVLADQGRVALEEFLRAAARRGLGSRVVHRVPAPEGEARPSITVYEVRR